MNAQCGSKPCAVVRKLLNSNCLTEEQRLQLHQLRLLDWIQDQQRKAVPDTAFMQHEANRDDGGVPSRWNLTKGIRQYSWQEECIERWFQGGYRGTVKVVTGAGKTILGLAIAQRLQNEVNPRLRVAIVVPTVVLMHQWYDELIKKGNLPPHAIGRLGGGYKDDFRDCRVLIAVLASAHKQLPKLARSGRHSRRLLLIADECHRAGATEMSRVFETQRLYSLGLSATPERDEDEGVNPDAGYNESQLGRELGPIIYDFNLRQALELGVVPRFTIRHYGIALDADEQARYNSLSRSIADTTTELRALAPDGRDSGGSFFRWAKSMAAQTGRASELAARLNSDISHRKDLLHQGKTRAVAVEAILRSEFSGNPETRAIIFHESIDEVMRLFVQLQAAGFSVIAEHSRLPGSMREEGLEIFRKGVARVVVSARSLIEGFNVPAVDVGIIAASSGSVRQRIQSLGRVLRRHRSRDGEEKSSVVHILYARNTVEDRIYGKIDWDRTTGVQQNLYFEWDPPEEPRRQDGPPRHPLPDETEVDVSELRQGDEYPGRYQGHEYTCDMLGNVRDASGAYASNAGDLSESVRDVKGSAGRFRITPRLGHVLVRVPRNDDWVTLLAGQRKEALEFGEATNAPNSKTVNPERWVTLAAPGDEYPFPNIAIDDDTVMYKQKRGGVLSRRVSNGEVFARHGDKADDPAKGTAATRLLDAIRELRQGGRMVSKLQINELHHVLFRERGRLILVCVLDANLEFPVREQGGMGAA